MAPAAAARRRPATAEAEFRLNTSDGRTFRAALDTVADRARWERRLADPAFQSTIRGVSILRDGVSHVLPAPDGFRETRYRLDRIEVDGELVAYRATAHSDAVRISITVYTGPQHLARVDVRHLGKVRYDPSREVSRR